MPAAQEHVTKCMACVRALESCNGNGRTVGAVQDNEQRFSRALSPLTTIAITLDWKLARVLAEWP